MASAQAWSIKKRWASKFEEFLRTSSVGHLALSLIRGDCVYIVASNHKWKMGQIFVAFSENLNFNDN